MSVLMKMTQYRKLHNHCKNDPLVDEADKRSTCCRVTLKLSCIEEFLLRKQEETTMTKNRLNQV